MFDFEKLDVYQKAKSFNKIVYQHIQTDKKIDSVTKNQLRRASFSVMLNIAEGSSRFSKADRRNFFVIARGSVFECVAIFDFMKEEKLFNESLHQDLYSKSEELSKMLFAMIKNLTQS
ncbi:MAG: four helix bundle protein [Bacteroidia bacterium]|jgi:four helix bundle protein|nr:four helix bundle protein [Bacteroidia bacterium]